MLIPRVTELTRAGHPFVALPSLPRPSGSPRPSLPPRAEHRAQAAMVTRPSLAA
jgi:hypothetical protein